MRTPPLLLAAALMFWGWQTDYVAVAAVMAIILESARLTKTRWDFSDEDFSRVWTFCTLLFLAAAVYAFTANEGPSNIVNFLQDPNLSTQRRAGNTSSRTAASLILWLPMTFFLFVAAQVYSTRDGIPLRTISLILQRRWRKARKQGQTPPAGRSVDVTFPYFAVCLFASCIHRGEDTSFFWGLCALLAWALWTQRSRRFSAVIWTGAMGVAIAAGYFGQDRLSEFQRYIENYNPQWLMQFTRRGFDPSQSRTSLGNVGRLKQSGRIVIRVEAPEGGAAPSLLREASYRVYKSPVWHAGSSKDDFENVPEEALNSASWTLLRDTPSRTTVNIACYLENRKDNSPAGLLPLPAGSTRLEKLPAFGLEKNSAGTVLAQGPSLVVFDAHYGPGATIDSPPDDDQDLNVPSREEGALDEVISLLQLDSSEPDHVLRAVHDFFQNEFTYRLWQDAPVRGPAAAETPLSRFLLSTRSGHCEYFATATVLLLRKLGIPARYAVGYAVHESSGRKYVVRQRDAHAWCLVWRNGKWEDFDTTPASWFEAESERASRLQFLSDAWSRVRFEIAKIRWGQSRLREYILWGLVPVLALLLYRIVFRKRGRKGGRKGDADSLRAWPGLDSEFYQLEKAIAERGVIRQPSEPLADWLQRAVAEPRLAELRSELIELLRLHYRYRFDPRGLSAEERDQLRRQAQRCRALLTESAEPIGTARR